MSREYFYRVFLAIPFDAATKSMYESVLEHLKSKYVAQFQFVLGTNTVIQSSPNFATIETFKVQNRDLLEQFYLRILSSDIVIADLTHNNPNVHVELGIAISHSKNILRVSGRDLVELGSDIKGYEVNKYTDPSSLRSMIESYLDRFLDIKRMPLNEHQIPYYKILFPKEQTIGEENPGNAIAPSSWLTGPLFAMRDGEIKVKFRFAWTELDEDWFGIFLRSGQENPWNGGYLVNVRKNGSLELTMMPAAAILVPKHYDALEIDKEHTLHTKIDGSNLVASLDEDFTDCLKFGNLTIQSYGFVSLGCFRSKVIFKEFQAINRDTIEFSSARA